MEQEIINEYIIGNKSMRSIAKIFNVNHKLVSRILKKNNMKTLQSLELSYLYHQITIKAKRK